MEQFSLVKTISGLELAAAAVLQQLLKDPVFQVVLAQMDESEIFPLLEEIVSFIEVEIPAVHRDVVDPRFGLQVVEDQKQKEG